MNLGNKSIESKNLLIILMLLQFTTVFAIIFDIPIARQVICLFYYTFIPGFILVKLLKLDRLSTLEIILLSVGFSIALLMFIGLLINIILDSIGILHPLSTTTIALVINAVTFAGAILTYITSGNKKNQDKEAIRLHPAYFFLLCPPILSIIGTIWMNLRGDNTILLSMLISIAAIFTLSVASKRVLPQKFYPMAIFSFSISLLYHSSLISNYIISFGSDAPVEYYTADVTLKNRFWDPVVAPFDDQLYGRIHSMLSITLLPTIYSLLLGMDITWIFKVINPMIFTFVPLGLYAIWEKHIRKKYAFIASFLFISQLTFYTEILALNRQMIAELFFVLLFFTILTEKIKNSKKIVCFTIFSFALVVSHYAIAEIFLVLILFAILSLILLKKPSRRLTVGMTVLFFVIMFSWYLFTTNASTFNSLLSFGEYVYNQLGEFFNPASRGTEIMKGLGLAKSPSIWNTISRVFAYCTQVLIVLGFIGLITKKVEQSIEKEFYIITLAAFTILILLIVIPGLANTLNMTRFYHVLLFFLSPLCVLGAEFLAKKLIKRRNEIVVFGLLIMILVPYFLFQTNFVYELIKSDSWSISLSSYRMNPIRLYGHFGYIDAHTAYGALWVDENFNSIVSSMYSDAPARYIILTSYGAIYRGIVAELTNVTIPQSKGIIYLHTLNLKEQILVSRGRIWNISELTFNFGDIDKIYANGNSEVYIYVP
ncbi:MAG: DUF2206 domain-containing protein [Candidatus Baldrarchaeia archaeon]